MFFFDPVYLMYALPGLILALWAQAKVQSTFAKYSKVMARSGLTGAEAARRIARGAGLSVDVEQVRGNLTDHYDPRGKVLRLSQPVYSSRSLAALGVAAHEAGHAIQDSRGYMPMKIRHGIFPVVSLGGTMAMPLFFIGLMMGGLQGVPFASTLMTFGIILFAAVVVFQVVTLPVEFNASKRALSLLVTEGIVGQDEAVHAKRVLNAAALTYVAATVQVLLTLLYMISRARR